MTKSIPFAALALASALGMAGQAAAQPSDTVDVRATLIGSQGALGITGTNGRFGEIVIPDRTQADGRECVYKVEARSSGSFFSEIFETEGGQVVGSGSLTPSGCDGSLEFIPPTFVTQCAPGTSVAHDVSRSQSQVPGASVSVDVERTFSFNADGDVDDQDNGGAAVVPCGSDGEITTLVSYTVRLDQSARPGADLVLGTVTMDVAYD